jgi:hypothetical protein
MLIRDCLLNFLKTDEHTCFEIVGETKSLDKLLQARRYLLLVSPISVFLHVVLDYGKHGLDLTEFFTASSGGFQSARAVAWVLIDRCVGEIIYQDTMQEEDDFLREVRDVAAMLLRDV